MQGSFGKLCLAALYAQAGSHTPFLLNHLTLSLVCSGPGTEYVANRHVDRHMWLRALGVADTGGFHVTDRSQVRQASEWDLLLLIGGAWEGNAGESRADSSRFILRLLSTTGAVGQAATA